MSRPNLFLARAFRRLWPILTVAAAVVCLDQWTKEWVRQNIPKNNFFAPIPVLSDYLVFEHVENSGAAFGIFQGYNEFFIGIAAVVTIGVLVYALRSLAPDQTLVRLLLGLQMGGAMGNFIDRISRGVVTDFVKVGIPGVYYVPNFNVADSALCCGAIGLALFIMWQDFRQSRLKQAEHLEAA